MAGTVFLPPVRRERIFRRHDHFVDMNDDETRHRYRFSSENIDRLVGLLPNLERPTARSQLLSPRQLVLLALGYFASSNFLETVGDTLGVNKGTVSRVVTAVTDAIVLLKDRYVVFPTSDEERDRIKASFFKNRGFPSVIGCIDGTHVRILSPPKAEEKDYVNRKNYHSINVQATCDDRGKLTSIYAAWPGSAHDAHVFRQSNLCYYLENNHNDLASGVLLGDSGYPCKSFLVTPYLNPRTEVQERYNNAHSSTRNTIERTFGRFKRKFHILHTEIRLKPAKACKVIVACAVLYNLGLQWNEPDIDEQIQDDQPPNIPYAGAYVGTHIRDHIANSYF